MGKAVTEIIGEQIFSICLTVRIYQSDQTKFLQWQLTMVRQLLHKTPPAIVSY